MRSVFAIILTILVHTISFAQHSFNINSGLSFKSHQSNLDDRTGLSLNTLQPSVNLKSGFAISFDFKLKEEEQTFGYVYRMVINEKSSLDFLVNLADKEFYFVLNDAGGQSVTSKKLVKTSNLIPNKYFHVNVLNYSDKIDIQVDDQKISLPKGLPTFENIQFYFGANKTKFFNTTEVPPMVIKNIQIKQGKDVLRKWVLEKHNKDIVYDEISNSPAKVTNPVWEIDKHVNWNRINSIQTQSAPQIAFDKDKGRVFIAAEDFVYTINLSTRKIDTVKVISGNPYRGISRQIIYNPKNDELVSYTVQSSTAYNFSFKTKAWTGSPDLLVDSRQHHNHILDTTNNNLYVLMGYGYHKYNNEVLKLNLNSVNTGWESLELKNNISPRYLSALGLLNDSTALLLGGYGSKSGKQEEYPHHFYDLHKINFKTGQSNKLWDAKLDTSIVFSNSMHIDKSNNKLFALGFDNFNYKTKAYLYSFGIDSGKPSVQKLANPIAFNFLDIESYCDLFFDENTQQLYAITSQKGADNNFDVNIYSIAFPIFSEKDILQIPQETFFWASLGWIAIFLILGLLFYVFVVRKEKNKNKKADNVNAFQPEIKNVSELNIENKQQLVINIFGDFQLIDKNNTDTSKEFTPILKQIFLAVLMYTVKNKQKGISSSLLDQTFWQGMSQEKAVNNRSVNMRKLRVLLGSIGDLQIEHTNGFWVLHINEEYKFDYGVVIETLKNITSDGNYTKDRIGTILNYANAKLLPNFEHEWLDIFKSEFTSLLIKVLHHSLTNEFKTDDLFRAKIADVILIHDALDETAVIYKCNLLYKLGQKGLSKSAYDKFVSDYQQMINDEPNLKYNEIINRNL